MKFQCIAALALLISVFLEIIVTDGLRSTPFVTTIAERRTTFCVLKSTADSRRSPRNGPSSGGRSGGGEAPKREFTKNNSANENRDRGDRGNNREWNSGAAFSKSPQRKRRNDPWWMREEESNNPRILPPYSPWWLSRNQITPSKEREVLKGRINSASDSGSYEVAEEIVVSGGPDGNVFVDDSWKVQELKDEALRRGLKPASKKDLLIAQLIESSQLHDLSDAGFVAAEFTPHSFDKNQPCFPHMYETPEELARLKKKASA